VVGLGLLAIAVHALLNGLVLLLGAATAPGGAVLACCATALIGFIAHQRRGAQPLMALGLFTHRNFALGGVVAFIYGMALFGSTYLVPVFMQIALQLPPSQAGAALLPAGIVLALTIPFAGRLTDRLPFGRIVAFGLSLLAASFLLMVTVGPASSLWWIVAWAVVGRIGLGFVLPSLNVGAMRGLPDTLISQGASTINFMRQLGGAVGISLVGIVLEWRLQAQPGAAVRAFHETFVLVGFITACAVIAALRMGVPAPGSSPSAS
jgi:predicted MFS family arabinose efflux permease